MGSIISKLKVFTVKWRNTPLMMTLRNDEEDSQRQVAKKNLPVVAPGNAVFTLFC